MKVLVTGGAGYIGSHAIIALLKQGHDIVIYDNLSTGYREALHPQAKFIFGDVRDSLMLARVMKDQKVEAIVHFAAKLVVPESVEKPLEYYENNTGGVLALAQAARQNDIDKIVFSSTAAVYGDANKESLVTEESAIAPLNPYGSSKYMSERILQDFGAAYSLRSVCLRYFNVAGAALDGSNGQRTLQATHLVKVASEAACGKREGLKIFGTDYPTADGTCVRDYIHVEDLADIHALALGYLAAGGKNQILNCGYGRGFSVHEVVQTMKKVSGVDFPVEMVPRRAGDAARLVADSSKLRELLHWQPRHADLELICRTAYDWEKSR